MGARFFAALVVDGALAGALYALVALSFVVVYRASRMMNFAVGEWVMLASRCVTFALHGLGLGLPGALAVGCAGMAGFGVAFNRVVLRRLVGPPVISGHHGDHRAGRARARGGRAGLRRRAGGHLAARARGPDRDRRRADRRRQAGRGD